MAIFSLAAAALGLVTLNGAELNAPVATDMGQHLILAQAAPSGDYMTTANGCTYRRTKAPGQPVRWIIIQNPHHIGKSGTRANCKAML